MIKTRGPSFDSFRPLALPLLALVAAMAGALGAAAFVLGAPPKDVLDLFRFLLFSSVPSMLLGFGLFIPLRRRLRLRGQIVLGYVLTLGVVLANVIVTAQLMFINAHDLALLSLLLVFAATLALAVGIALAGTLSRDLERLAGAARRMAEGDFTTRVALDGADEVGKLGEAFNRMAGQVEEAFERERAVDQKRREMIAAISHDLRTPVASARAMIEAVLDDVVPDEAMATRYLATTREEMERLGRLIDDLFELARLEAGTVEMEMVQASLEDIVSDTLQSVGPQAQTRGLRLEGNVEEDIGLVRMSPRQIQRVLDNLVQNAIRHTPEGGTISINVRPITGSVEVSVSDSGEGIAPEDLPHIFEQFYRGEKSRSVATGGAGLGLAIARGIVEAHGGDIRAESIPGQGTRVAFTLPEEPTGGWAG